VTGGDDPGLRAAGHAAGIREVARVREQLKLVGHMSCKEGRPRRHPVAEQASSPIRFAGRGRGNRTGLREKGDVGSA
jgi:hypothetical protein